jgi:serine/threonine protein phosphatase PrpC
MAIVRKEENGDRRCYVGNLGDTRAVLVMNGTAYRLSEDHKASVPEEINRVMQQQGFIYNLRLGGVLAITRCLGDLELLSIVN